MLTEAQSEEAYERYKAIAKAVAALVDEMTKGLSSEQDNFVRDMLTDTHRFWRQD